MFVSSIHLPECMLSLWLCLAGFMLLIQSCGCFRLFLRCLVLASLHRMVLLVSVVTTLPVVWPSLSLFYVLFSASLLSIVITFGSPEVSFILFDIFSGLLRFLYTPLPFLSLRLGSPTAVPGVWFPFLLIMYLLRVSQHPAVVVAFPCFLSGFFLVWFPLGASRLCSPDVVSVSPSFCFAGLSVITSGSLSWCWFRPSAPFLCFSPPCPLLSHQLGYSC